MSRIVPHNQTFSGSPISSSNGTGSFSATFDTLSYADRGYTNTSSDTYAQLRPKTSIGYYRYNFDCSSIPANATIDSISCSVKVRASNGTGLSTATIQLATGNSLKGSEYDFHTSTSTNVQSLTTGSWTREELNDIYLLITGQRSSNNRYVYFYGADLTITYSYNEIQYQLTVSSESETQATISRQNEWNGAGEDVVVTISNVQDLLTLGVFDNDVNVSSDLVSSGQNSYIYTIENISDDHDIVLRDVATHNVSIVNNSTNITSLVPSTGNNYTVGDGSNFDVEIYSNDISKVQVYDNDVNKTNEIVEMSLHEEDTITLTPSSYSNNSFSTASSLTNGYSDTSSTSRANLQASTSTQQSIDYSFDVSGIPNEAEILSVSCKVKICVSGNYANTSYVRLYSGDNTKSNQLSTWYNKTAITVYDLSGIGSFTREELSNLVLRISGKSGSNGRSIYFYGAELTVSYEYNGGTYYLYTATNITQDRTIRFEDKAEKKVYFKSSGSYQLASKIYSKINGVWVEQTDASSVFENNKIYINN